MVLEIRSKYYPFLQTRSVSIFKGFWMVLIGLVSMNGSICIFFSITICNTGV